MEHARELGHLAARLVDSVGEPERGRLLGSLDDPARSDWSYLPGDRPGLPLELLDPDQRRLVDQLLVATHGEVGAELATGAIEIERVRRRLATGREEIGADRYWVRIRGAPGDGTPWSWQLNGHHLAVHAVVAGDRVTLTPHFVGAEPARVPTGPEEGRRLMAPEEDLARELLAALDESQLDVAVAAAAAPDDILTRCDPVADPGLLPEGISLSDLEERPRLLLDRLVRRYLDRAPAAYADACWREAQAGQVSFAWAGPLEVGAGHYYCVRTQSFLIEYDNTQDDANHAHSVWRHLRDDWGGDPLRAHYAAEHVPPDHATPAGPA